jgi:hypothetical protein
MSDTDTCAVCGDVTMSVIAASLVTEEGMLAYGTCPKHVDTVVARVQDELHEAMTIQEGALLDWWAAQQPVVDDRMFIEEEPAEDPPLGQLPDAVPWEPADPASTMSVEDTDSPTHDVEAEPAE